MENFVTRSKYVSETISILVDFADVLYAGQTIQGTPTVSIALETGDDPAPANILYLGVSVRNGTVVEQRFRLGVPGVIYEITWEISTGGGEAFERTTYLAILPNVGSAAPNHQYLFLTSQLYPLQAQDSLGVSFAPQNGSWYIAQTWVQDYLQVSFAPLSGTFTPGQIFYTTVAESIKVSFSVADGTFTLGQVFYTSIPEQLKVSFAPLDGTITVGQIFYTTKSDEVQVSFLPLSGTFVHA